MMQRFMQEQKQPDPIPNMQYLAPGGGQAGATAMGQTAAAGTQQAEASSSAQQALVATTAECKKPGVQLEMSDPEDDEAEVLRQAGLVADVINKKTRRGRTTTRLTSPARRHRLLRIHSRPKKHLRSRYKAPNERRLLHGHFLSNTSARGVCMRT